MSGEGAYKLIAAFFSGVTDGIAMAAADPTLVHQRTALGETPLHYLCVENQLEAVQALAKRGAAINVVNDVGSTPLSDAASLGYAEMVRLLLTSGANLRVNGQSEPTLHQAVRSGDLETVRIVLDAGADVNERADLAETALHLAAEGDYVDIAQLLLTRGADQLLQRIFEETALDVAIRNNSQQCIALLSVKQ